MAKDYEYFDVSLPLGLKIPTLPDAFADGPIPEPTVYRFSDANKGDLVTMCRIDISSHDGTHIDCPLHMIPGGTTIDVMPFETTLGPCRVIEIKDEKSVTVAELEPHKIKAGERILFKTRNSAVVYSVLQYTGSYVGVSPEAARYLAERKVRLVGIDYLTISTMGSLEYINTVHTNLLRNGVYILEGLNLAAVKPGNYELICLPLLIDKGDAGPCRAILRK